MMRLLVPALAACLGAVLSGCSPAPGHPPDPSPRPDMVMDFATLYSENCAACHGSNGQNGPAIDLANPEYQALIDDATLRKWIANGMPGTEMPAFAESAGGMLTDHQIDVLVGGMRKAWSQSNVFAGLTAPPYAQTQSGDVHRGELAYQVRCSSCHQTTSQQIKNSNYLALINDQTLRSMIVAGRPDIGQPDWRHDNAGGKPAAPLSAQDVDDIVSYLGSLRNAPSSASTGQAGR